MKPARFVGNLPFWKDEHIARYERPLVMLCKQHGQLMKGWPGVAPSLSNLLEELGLARMVYIRIYQQRGRDGESIELVAGRIRVLGNVWVNSDGYLRISASMMSYADNRSRATLVAKGFRLALQGIFIYDGPGHRERERADEFIQTGRHVRDLLGLRDQFVLSGSDSEPEEVDEQVQRTSNETGLLSMMEQYIDAEYAQEEMVARQTPPFSYISAKAEPRKIVYRQFYRLKLTDSDHQRLLELSPSLLRFANEDKQEGLLAQIVNLKPDDKESDIIISIEKQAQKNDIPKSGQLFLTAIPTLRNVRLDVIDKLKQGITSNQWMLPVAAGEYIYKKYSVENSQPPPAANPPTTSQLDAFRRGLHTPDYVLTLGPPGTGKTTVILNWVRELVKRGERVLVTSQNNKAVDNVLERLAEEKTLQCVRIGSETKVSTRLHPILVDNAATVLQEKLAENINATLDYLERCQQYFDGLHSHIQRLEELSRACEAIADKRRQLIRNELEPRQQKHADEQRKRRISEDEIHKLQDRLQMQSEKYGAWQRANWILKLVAIFVSPFIKTKMSFIGWRIDQEKNNLDRITQEITRQLSYIATITQAVEQQENVLRQALQARNDAIPKPLESPYKDVNFGFDLSDEDLFINSGMLDKKICQFTAWKKVVLEWKEALGTMRQQSLYQISLEMVDVVGATCIGINTNPAFKSIPFDTVIVDESGQIQLHNLMVPLSRAKRSILVGDHKQLPPVVQQELIEELEARDVETDLMKKSWFEQLWSTTSADRRVILDTQYRCPAIISDYISGAFYENRYYAGKGMEKKQALFSFAKSPLVFIDTSSLSLVQRKESTFASEGRNQVKDNLLETDAVVSLLEHALKEKPELGESEIGIVVPYKNHVVAIRQAIRKVQKAGRLDALKIPLVDLVASVDSFQGQERDLIIQAFSRSNREKNVGFLQDWRRLNVGMTRAKMQLIMVGDMKTLSELSKKNEADPAREFKQAMATLRSFVKERGHLMDIRDWQAYSSAQENHG